MPSAIGTGFTVVASSKLSAGLTLPNISTNLARDSLSLKMGQPCGYANSATWGWLLHFASVKLRRDSVGVIEIELITRFVISNDELLSSEQPALILPMQSETLWYDNGQNEFWVWYYFVRSGFPCVRGPFSVLTYKAIACRHPVWSTSFRTYQFQRGLSSEIYLDMSL